MSGRNGRLRCAAVGLLLLACGPVAAFAAEPPPPPPPGVEQIKACIKQMDVSGQWTFDWKSIEIGPARHPLNAYEKTGLADPDAAFGYPVHAVFDFNHIETIDARYWMTQDSAGRWRIPSLCRP